MKWILCIFWGYAAISYGPLSALASAIVWQDSFEAAFSQKKPLCVFCPGKGVWSKKFEQEVFQDAAFVKAVGNQMVFLRSDLIQEKPSFLPSFAEENLPICLVFDEKKQQITQFGYIPFGGEGYAKHLLEAVATYRSILHAVNGKCTAVDLEKKWQEAKQLGCLSLEDKILEKGLQDSSSTFFLLEKYAQLDCSMNAQQRKDLRQEIELRDPNNLRGSFYRLALLDFQYLVKRIKNSSDPKEIIQPLTDYLAHFPEDEERIWKVEMMVSQYLFTKGLLNDALIHARACYKKAPISIRKDIADSIQHIRGEMRAERKMGRA